MGFFHAPGHVVKLLQVLDFWVCHWWLCAWLRVFCADRHWRLQLLGAKVNTVREQAPGEWEISATVNEEGSLLDEHGAVQDEYRTRYNVKYTAAVGGAGHAWVIIGGEDL